MIYKVAERTGLPFRMLLAIAIGESNLAQTLRKGRYYGLWQIWGDGRGSILADYNSATGHAYVGKDLIDPGVQVDVASWIFPQVFAAYPSWFPMEKREHFIWFYWSWLSGWTAKNGVPALLARQLHWMATGIGPTLKERRRMRLWKPSNPKFSKATSALWTYQSAYDNERYSTKGIGRFVGSKKKIEYSRKTMIKYSGGWLMVSPVLAISVARRFKAPLRDLVDVWKPGTGSEGGILLLILLFVILK